MRSPNHAIEIGRMVELGFTGFYWVWLGLTRITGFYWVLLGFTGFYWVLPSCWMVRDFLFGFFVRPGTDFEFTKKAQLRAAERRPVRPHRRRGRRWLRPLRQPVLAAPMQVQFQNPVKPSKTHYNWVKPSQTQSNPVKPSIAQFNSVKLSKTRQIW